jgi:hypothetical protein
MECEVAEEDMAIWGNRLLIALSALFAVLAVIFIGFVLLQRSSEDNGLQVLTPDSAEAFETVLDEESVDLSMFAAPEPSENDNRDTQDTGSSPASESLQNSEPEREVLPSLRNKFIDLQRDRPYDQQGASLEAIRNSDGQFIRWDLTVEDELVYAQLSQWYLEDPQAFIELSKIERNDEYIRAVLRQNVTPSNVYILAEHLHIRQGHLIDLAYEKQLHLQQPELFLELFDQFVGSRFIDNSEQLMFAVAETHYWDRRDALIREAVNNPAPALYFDVLEQQQQEDMTQLAQQMWAVHQQDAYEQTPGTSTAHIERIRLAFRYGIDGAKAQIAALQNDGIRVDETIKSYTDVDNAVDVFQEVYPSLVFDSAWGKWVLP